MDTPSDPSAFGSQQAQALLEAGWRQGSVFRLPESLGIEVDYDSATEWLVVCTQSCTVVSPTLVGDPLIEGIVATPLVSYSPKDPRAVGKQGRKLHLPVTGLPGAQGIECDINRRFTFPRDHLLNFSPAFECQMTLPATRQLAGWLGRYYTRVALPNELVARLDIKLFKYLDKALKTKTIDGAALADGIAGIYILWEPADEELVAIDQGGPAYRLNLLFLCETDEQDNVLNKTVEAGLKPFESDNGCDGVVLKWNSQLKANTFLSDLDGYVWFSQYDYLSNLGDLADTQSRNVS